VARARLVSDFYPQFTAKQLNRQSAKAGKDEQTEKAKLKKVRIFKKTA